MKKYLIVLSDLHINSTVGLCNNEVKLDDGGKYLPSKSQKWLLKCWEHFYNFTSENIKDSKSVTLVINGDVLDTHKLARHQLITQNKATILNHAVELIKPFTDMVSHTFVIRGTESHVGSSGELEEEFAARINAVTDPETGLNSFWNLQLEINKKLVDFGHHGRVGGKPWNRNSPLYSLAAEIMIEGMKNNTKVPDLVFRSHCHTFGDTEKALPVRVIQTPCWQLNTAYSHKMGFVNKPDIGGILVSFDDKNYDLEVALYDVPKIPPIRL